MTINEATHARQIAFWENKRFASSALIELAQNWRDRSRHRFVSAEKESTAMGKRLIEHGAMCYLNCANELMEALNG